MKWFLSVLEWAGIIEMAEPEPAPAPKKKAAPKKKKVEVDLNAMTKKELVDFATKGRIQLKTRMTKAEMISTIKNQL